MLPVSQGGIKYYFWVFEMTRPGIEPPVSRAIGEHSTKSILMFVISK